MNKPESFQSYIEHREDPEGGNISIGVYNFLKEKLDEARAVMSKQREQNNEELRRKVEGLYQSRVFNKNVHDTLTGIEKNIEITEDALRVAETIKSMQANSGMPEDNDLNQFIEGQKEILASYKQKLTETSEAIEANEASQAKRLNPNVMGMMEEDAHREDREKTSE